MMNKTTIMRKKLLVMPYIVVGMLTSCEKIDFSTETSSSDKKNELMVYTRSGDGEELKYPLEVFAFDAKGQWRDRKTLIEEGSAFSMQLSSGSYSIVALGGTSACEIPDEPKLNSFLTLIKGTDTPLQMGRADISMGESSAKAYLQMQYLVSNVNVQLSGLPRDVSAVSMSLSKPYSKWSFDGVGNAPLTYTYDLQEGSLPGEWYSGNTYLFPTEGTATLTLNITSPTGSTSYAYTCPEPLCAGVPYVLNGSYSMDELVVEGEFAVEGWAETVNWDFNFGPGASNEEVTPPQSDDQPVVGQLWQNHIVAYVEDLNETEWSVYLLSRDEAEDMPSAYSTDDDPTKALTYAAAYVEEDLTDWSIPTKEEAQMLQQSLGGNNLIALNTVLTQEGLPLFLDYEPGSATEKARYLCDNADKSFSMAGTTAPSKAGEKKKYRLRLVKEITVNK